MIDVGTKQNKSSWAEEEDEQKGWWENKGAEEYEGEKEGDGEAEVFHFTGVLQ